MILPFVVVVLATVVPPEARPHYPQLLALLPPSHQYSEGVGCVMSEGVGVCDE